MVSTRQLLAALELFEAHGVKVPTLSAACVGAWHLPCTLVMCEYKLTIGRRWTARGAWRRRGCARGRPARSWRRWWRRRSPRWPAPARPRPPAPRGSTAPAPLVRLACARLLRVRTPLRHVLVRVSRVILSKKPAEHSYIDFELCFLSTVSTCM